MKIKKHLLLFILALSHIAFAGSNDFETTNDNLDIHISIPRRKEYKPFEAKINSHYLTHLTIDNIHYYSRWIVAKDNQLFVLASTVKANHHEYCAYALQTDASTYCTPSKKKFLEFLGKDTDWVPYIYRKGVAFPLKKYCIDSFSCNDPLLYDTGYLSLNNSDDEGFVTAETKVKGYLPPLFAYTFDGKNIKHCTVKNNLGDTLALYKIYQVDSNNFYLAFTNAKSNFLTLLLFNNQHDLQGDKHVKIHCQSKILKEDGN